MIRLLPVLAAGLVLAGCATKNETNSLPNSAAAVVVANEDQILLAKRRAEVIVSRLTETERTALAKPGYFAVRTLGPTPEQLAVAQPPINTPVFGVMLWNMKTSQLDGSNLYLAPGLPPVNQYVRFNDRVARYLGSF